MESLRKNKNIIIAIILVVLVNVGLIFILAKPLHLKVQAKKDVVEQNKQRLENIKKEGEKWQEYRQKREELESSRELLVNSNVKKETQIDLIKRLEQIAEEEGVKVEIQSQDGVELNKKDASSKKKEETPEDMTFFSLTIDGEYNEILDYVYKLENLNYVLKIVSSNIKTRSAVPTLRNQKQPTEEETKSLQAKVIISFIFQK